MQPATFFTLADLASARDSALLFAACVLVPLAGILLFRGRRRIFRGLRGPALRDAAAIAAFLAIFALVFRAYAPNPLDTDFRNARVISGDLAGEEGLFLGTGLAVNWRYDQPEGTGLLLAPLFSFFSARAGSGIFVGISAALAFGLFVCAAMRLFGGGPARLLLAGALGFLSVSNLLFPGISGLWPHLTALLMTSAFLLFGLSAGGSGVLAGVAAAALVATRHEYAVFLAPAFASLLFLGKKGGASAAKGFLSGFSPLVAVLALFHQLAFGSIVFHESQRPTPTDPMYFQCLGPACFPFNGLLNFQGGTIVRTPGYPYPTFIGLPLVLASALGLLLLAAAVTGSLLGPRPLAPALAAGVLALLLLFAPMENWGFDKTGLAAGLLPALFLLAFLGISAAERSPAGSAAVFSAALVLMLLLSWAISRLPDFPEDVRWRVRVPTGELPSSPLERSIGAMPPLLPRVFLAQEGNGGGALGTQ